MPFKCCVPACRGNYDSDHKLSVFSFPKDEGLKTKWIRAINRENFTPTKYSKVCELHFLAKDIERSASMYDEKTGRHLEAPLTYPRLTKDAVPSQMPGCPKYMSKTEATAREPPEDRRCRLENEAIRLSLEENMKMLNAYNEAKCFKSFDELKGKFNNISLPSDWVIIPRNNNICAILFNEVPCLRVKCYVWINQDLYLSVFTGEVEIHSLDKISLPMKVDDINTIEKIICSANLKLGNSANKETTVLEDINIILDVFKHLEVCLPDSKSRLEFLKEQISLLPVSKAGVRYSWETMTLSCLLHTISPHAYKYLLSLEVLKLPCTSTLRQVCNRFATNPQLEQDDKNFLGYISKKFNLLSDEDKTVALLMDEISLKPNMDYKSGNVVGNATDSVKCATRAYVFMICSLKSQLKDVIHIAPMNTISGETLHKFVKTIIIALENIGFEVLAVISDNHSVNRKAMSLFSVHPELTFLYPHPKDPTRNLYFIVDTVHILKCIRNNWLNNFNQEILYPDFDDVECTSSHVASFSSLKEMYELEKEKLLRYGHCLSLKALYPSSLERQNVKLAMAIFSKSTSVALKELGRMKGFTNWETTATFIDIICKWWDIVNVKTPLKGQRLRNIFQEPITTNSVHILQFLEKFVGWLERWRKQGNAGQLSKESAVALKHSTQALIHISQFLIKEKGFNYVLCGKLQNDSLEDRFGKYRQLAGAQYLISVRQMFETESKLRFQNIMPLIYQSSSSEAFSVDINSTNISAFLQKSEEMETVAHQILIDKCVVHADDIDNIQDDMWPLINYIAGYCAYSIMKTLKCEYCKHFLTSTSTGSSADHSLIVANDRGGLCYPHEDVVMCVSHAHVVMDKVMCSETECVFLQQRNQRNVFISLCKRNVPSLIFMGHGCTSHSINYLTTGIFRTTANILLNNYTKKRSDIRNAKSMPQCKRSKVVGSRPT